MLAIGLQGAKVTVSRYTSFNINRLLYRHNIATAYWLNVSFAWFCKALKTYTGIAPNQYLLQLKIEKAKAILFDQTKTIKEIAFGLNFKSAFYLSKLFKEKIGISPELYPEKYKTAVLA